MATDTTPQPGPLSGLRLGLSGAVPDREDWQGRALDLEIPRLLATLAEGLFRFGGELVHGTHPSFTPILIGQARPYAARRGRPLVTLVRSRLWPDDALRLDIAAQAAQGAVRLVETEPLADPATGVVDPGNAGSRNLSLAAMRWALLADIHALVVVGGKRWRGSANEPGTKKELDAALERALPCFLLGGFGGMTEDLAADPAYRERLGNGLSPEENAFLATTRNHAGAVATLLAGLTRLWRDRARGG